MQQQQQQSWHQQQQQQMNVVPPMQGGPMDHGMGGMQMDDATMGTMAVAPQSYNQKTSERMKQDESKFFGILLFCASWPCGLRNEF